MKIGKNTLEKLDKKTTNCLRAFLIIGVMLHHYSGKVNSIILYPFLIAGYVCVAIFLFLSGYGNYKSYIKKTITFSWIIKRFEKLLFPYFIVLVLNFIFLIANGENIDFWYCIFNLTIPGQVLWYLKVQIILYIIFAIVFSIGKLSNENKCRIINFLLAIYIVAAIFFDLRPYWYMTVIFFGFGINFAVYENRYFELIRKSRLYWNIVLGIICLALFTIQFFYGNAGIGRIMDVLYEFFVLTFVIILAMQLNIQCRLLERVGIISFEIYLSHILVLNVFDLLQYDFNKVYTAVLWFVLSIALGWGINKINEMICIKYFGQLLVFDKKGEMGNDIKS